VVLQRFNSVFLHGSFPDNTPDTVLKAAGKRHSVNDRLAMWAMTGAKTSTDERSRLVGSTSVGDCLSRVVVSTFRTSSAVVSDSVGPVCRQPWNTGSVICCRLAAIHW